MNRRTQFWTGGSSKFSHFTGGRTGGQPLVRLFAFTYALSTSNFLLVGERDSENSLSIGRTVVEIRISFFLLLIYAP